MSGRANIFFDIPLRGTTGSLASTGIEHKHTNTLHMGQCVQTNNYKQKWRRCTTQCMHNL
jgi:hypothetical protein